MLETIGTKNKSSTNFNVSLGINIGTYIYRYKPVFHVPMIWKFLIYGENLNVGRKYIK